MAGISKKNEGRISLALKPSTAKALRQLAYLADKSTNDYISKILDNVVERNAAILQEFQTIEIKARQAVQSDLDTAQD